MILPYSFDDRVSLGDIVTDAEATVGGTAARSRKTTRELPLMPDKTTVPDCPDLVSRPRITDFLARSAHKFGANLISGRARTGKTYAAVDLARLYKRVGWYTIDGTDIDWPVFAAYLTRCIAPGMKALRPGEKFDEGQTADLLGKLFKTAAKSLGDSEMLIVLDEIHHIFDAPWFGAFFTQLLSSVPPNIHLLLLCRSKPPLPLWRMRSKQVLNVVEEKLLAFDAEETLELCRGLGLPKEAARQVPASAFGRAGTVADILHRDGLPIADTGSLDSQTPLFVGNTDLFVP